MNIYVNELSVDILLYLAGKLDLLGPYAVRQSAIFPNSCKVLGLFVMLLYFIAV